MGWTCFRYDNPYHNYYKLLLPLAAITKIYIILIIIQKYIY